MAIIEVKVKLKSNKTELLSVSNNKYIAYLKSLPINKQANIELINLIAEYFNIAKSDINIKTGHKSINKIVEIL